SVEKEDVMVPRYQLKLIICNNQPDTIYVRRDNIDMIFPVLTDDIAEIADGRSFIYVNNADSFISKPGELRKITVDADWSFFSQEQNLSIVKQEENNEKPQFSRQGNIYYKIAPEKCITVNAMIQSIPAELFKL